MANITITVPNNVGQLWTLVGPTGKVASNIGPGRVYGTSIPNGPYTITWDAVPGYEPGISRVDGPIDVVDNYEFISPAYTPITSNITSIWANDGADKVTQYELRAEEVGGDVTNDSWDGTKVIVKGARNEVTAFSLYLEAGLLDATNVDVSFSLLNERDGSNQITSAPRTTAQLYEWEGSNIELFYTRYLQIKGLSTVSYDGLFYDERHVPGGDNTNLRMRRPWELEPIADTERGVPFVGSELWEDRPDSDEYYPDILVPIEAQEQFHPGASGQFDITAGTVQQIWCDIYIPKEASPGVPTPPGVYEGVITIVEDSGAPRYVNVELTVYDFDLSDESAAPAFVYIGDYQINSRHYDTFYPAGNDASITTRDNYVKLLHRHRLSVVGDERGNDTSWTYEDIPDWWLPRLNGELFTKGAPHYYDGPGEGVGNRIYSIGQYADWRDKWSSDSTTNKPTINELQTKLAAWNGIFTNYDALYPNQPVERFVYLADEPIKPTGVWNLASSGGGAPGPGNFTSGVPLKNTAHTFRIHRSSEGLYTANVATHWKDYGVGDVLLLQREDDPENEYAYYELVADVTLEGPLDSNGDGDIRVIQVIPHLDGDGLVQMGGDLNFGDFGLGEKWRITAGSKYVVYYHDVNHWADWAKSTGIKSFTTVSWPKANEAWGVPNVDHPAHPGNFDSALKAEAMKAILESDPERLQVVYNGKRPLIGSFATEDDGVALTTIPWVQYRLGIDWWFYWESTYYFNYTTNENNRVFEDALTWGESTRTDTPGDYNFSGKGETGNVYGNGNGLLLYPGTNLKQPIDSYGVDGPFASIRLKMWRRGIQDMEYVEAAKAKVAGTPNEANALVFINAIVEAGVPSALWEIGVATEDDPGYQYADVSWEIDPDFWSSLRGFLAGYADGTN